MPYFSEVTGNGPLVKIQILKSGPVETGPAATSIPVTLKEVIPHHLLKSLHRQRMLMWQLAETLLEGQFKPDRHVTIRNSKLVH